MFCRVSDKVVHNGECLQLKVSWNDDSAMYYTVYVVL